MREPPRRTLGGLVQQAELREVGEEYCETTRCQPHKEPSHCVPHVGRSTALTRDVTEIGKKRYGCAAICQSAELETLYGERNEGLISLVEVL